ncbi:hypothetical protein CCUS01_17011 [Colletotrichum cuscutae]|uniref:Uncharacterized protein n=1 Tax=Colletotrichum cuscutae TaxID=1209917 RepID=A0AAI9V7J0_9PEZI|nr:hypothetical protein CCUS01_17011 [Colletotrichum cuscutae]
MESLLRWPGTMESVFPRNPRVVRIHYYRVSQSLFFLRSYVRYWEKYGVNSERIPRYGEGRGAYRGVLELHTQKEFPGAESRGRSNRALEHPLIWVILLLAPSTPGGHGRMGMGGLGLGGRGEHPDLHGLRKKKERKRMRERERERERQLAPLPSPLLSNTSYRVVMPWYDEEKNQPPEEPPPAEPCLPFGDSERAPHGFHGLSWFGVCLSCLTHESTIPTKERMKIQVKEWTSWFSRRPKYHPRTNSQSLLHLLLRLRLRLLLLLTPSTPPHRQETQELARPSPRRKQETHQDASCMYRTLRSLVPPHLAPPPSNKVESLYPCLSWQPGSRHRRRPTYARWTTRLCTTAGGGGGGGVSASPAPECDMCHVLHCTGLPACLVSFAACYFSAGGLPPVARRFDYYQMALPYFLLALVTRTGTWNTRSRLERSLPRSSECFVLVFSRLVQRNISLTQPNFNLHQQHIDFESNPNQPNPHHTFSNPNPTNQNHSQPTKFAITSRQHDRFPKPTEAIVVLQERLETGPELTLFSQHLLPGIRCPTCHASGKEFSNFFPRHCKDVAMRLTLLGLRCDIGNHQNNYDTPGQRRTATHKGYRLRGWGCACSSTRNSFHPLFFLPSFFGGQIKIDGWANLGTGPVIGMYKQHGQTNWRLGLGLEGEFGNVMVAAFGILASIRHHTGSLFIFATCLNLDLRRRDSKRSIQMQADDTCMDRSTSHGPDRDNNTGGVVLAAMPVIEVVSHRKAKRCFGTGYQMRIKVAVSLKRVSRWMETWQVASCIFRFWIAARGFVADGNSGGCVAIRSPVSPIAVRLVTPNGVQDARFRGLSKSRAGIQEGAFQLRSRNDFGRHGKSQRIVTDRDGGKMRITCKTVINVMDLPRAPGCAKIESVYRIAAVRVCLQALLDEEKEERKGSYYTVSEGQDEGVEKKGRKSKDGLRLRWVEKLRIDNFLDGTCCLLCQLPDWLASRMRSSLTFRSEALVPTCLPHSQSQLLHFVLQPSKLAGHGEITHDREPRHNLKCDPGPRTQDPDKYLIYPPPPPLKSPLFMATEYVNLIVPYLWIYGSSLTQDSEWVSQVINPGHQSHVNVIIITTIVNRPLMSSLPKVCPYQRNCFFLNLTSIGGLSVPLFSESPRYLFSNCSLFLLVDPTRKKQPWADSTRNVATNPNRASTLRSRPVLSSSSLTICSGSAANHGKAKSNGSGPHWRWVFMYFPPSTIQAALGLGLKPRKKVQMSVEVGQSTFPYKYVRGVTFPQPP